MVNARFFRLKAGVFALVLSVLCVQSNDGFRACVKARFQTQSHEGSMKAVGYNSIRGFLRFLFKIRFRLFIRSLARKGIGE